MNKTIHIHPKPMKNIMMAPAQKNIVLRFHFLCHSSSSFSNCLKWFVPTYCCLNIFPYAIHLHNEYLQNKYLDDYYKMAIFPPLNAVELFEKHESLF